MFLDRIIEFTCLRVQLDFHDHNFNRREWHEGFAIMIMHLKGEDGKYQSQKVRGAR